MILALLLTIIFVFMSVYSIAFVQRSSIRYLLCFTYILAIFFVWHPNSTTTIAKYFGIGRGLDLIEVLFSVAIINGLLFVIKHLIAQHHKITLLSRYLAIRDAQVISKK